MPPSRTERFMVRVDHELPRLKDDAARCALLDAMINAFTRRYANFVDGATEPTGADPPQAADFMLTIVALAARRRVLDR